MFAKHGDLMIRVWPGVLVAWIGILILTTAIAPPLDRVAQTEEFKFLPADSPSHVGEELFREAFPKKLVPSRIVIVVRRPDQPEGLQDRDLEWIDDGIQDGDKDRQFELLERLLQIAEKDGGLAKSPDNEDPAPDGEIGVPRSTISDEIGRASCRERV